MVVIGHSMGGMIARLLVSSADNQLHDWAMADARTDPNQNDPERTLLNPMLRFEPPAGIERAIFIATPHRGTAIAGYQPVRWLSVWPVSVAIDGAGSRDRRRDPFSSGHRAGSGWLPARNPEQH